MSPAAALGTMNCAPTKSRQKRIPDGVKNVGGPLGSLGLPKNTGQARTLAAQ